MNYEHDADVNETEDFPSWSLIVLLYSLGALVSLACAFNSALSSIQTTNCLLISWFLALGALGISVLADTRDATDTE